MRRLLARGAPIDGLFAANDQMAVGAYSALHEAGLSVPHDVSVVGFDNDKYAPTATPPLTTVNQSTERMGAKMAEVLIRLIDGDESVPRATRLPAELVVRASTSRKAE
jgi:LacI family transcriptional regulator